MNDFDVIIIGAGAAGLMCAMTAGQRGRSVAVIDHIAKPGEKIRISGGGRCNFTNKLTTAENFLSQNPRFCRSALAGFTPDDFIALMERYHIFYHERDHGQLFCDDSAQQIIDMLLDECRKNTVLFHLQTRVENIERASAPCIERASARWIIQTDKVDLRCAALVIATGGKSVPKSGATGFGYEYAAKSGLDIITPRPGLVPLVFSGALKDQLGALAGISLEVVVSIGKTRFREALLFTHRGLSGPAILQISSYWREAQVVSIDLAPDLDVFGGMKDARRAHPKQGLVNILAHYLPRRLAKLVVAESDSDMRMADLSDKRLGRVAARIKDWQVVPTGSEGYRTAEVTLGGVDTRELSSKTLQCRNIAGLYFIGEVVDVSGHLGGFNFQWAWSSGYAAGRSV